MFLTAVLSLSCQPLEHLVLPALHNGGFVLHSVELYLSCMCTTTRLISTAPCSLCSPIIKRDFGIKVVVLS